MKVTYEINVKFEIHERVGDIEDISDMRDLAESIAQKMCDDFTSCNAAATYDISVVKLNAVKSSEENVSNFLFIKRNEII